MGIPLPTIMEQELDMLAVIDKDNLLIQQTNSWRSAYLKWQQLLPKEDWVPDFIVTSVGLGFYELSRAKSGEIILSANNQEAVYKKAYKLNYESYSVFWQKAKSGCRSNNSYINPEINFKGNTLNNISAIPLERSFLEILRDKLLKKSEPDKILTSRMILDLPEVIDLPINEYEQLCQMLVLSGVMIFDSDEQLKKWQEKNVKKRVLPSEKVGKCFKRFFKKAIKIDDSQKVLIDELMKQPRLHRGGVNFYHDRAQNGDFEATFKLFNHYSGPAIKSALSFYENHSFSSLELCDLIQESLLILFKAINEIKKIGKKQFQTGLAMRFYHGFSRIWITDLPTRLPVHIFEKSRNILEFWRYKKDICISNKLVEKISKKLKLKPGLVAKLLMSFSNVESFENLKIKELDLQENSDCLFHVQDMEKQLLNTTVLEVLETLKSRERDVIKERFGIGNTSGSKTLEEIGLDFNVTRERIRQIEQKALRKLRHPSRLKKLKDFYLCC